jgi:hypothetical protein
MKTIETRVIDTLLPHPRNAALYGGKRDVYDDKMVEALKAGIWPGHIQVTTGNVIISGHRRCVHAIFAGIEEAEVWVRVDLPEDPDSPEVLEVLLQGNLRDTDRDRDNETLLREVALWKEVAAKRAAYRMLEGAKQGRETRNGKVASGPKVPRPDIGRARDEAVRKVFGEGLKSGRKHDQALQALHAADAAEATGDAEQVEKAKKVKQELTKSLGGAVRVAREQGLIAAPKPKAAQVQEPQQEQVAPAPEPKAKTPPRPEHLRQTLDTHTPYLKNRLLVAAEHLVEAHRLIKQEQNRYGNIWEKENIVFTTHFQEVVAYWNERGIFSDFARVFEDESIKTFDDVLRHMVQLFKRTSERTEGIRTFTGCKPDHNKAHLFKESDG